MWTLHSFYQENVNLLLTEEYYKIQPMLYAGGGGKSHTCVPARSPKNSLHTVDTQHQAHLSVFSAYNSVLLYFFQPYHSLLWPLLCEAGYKKSDI